MFNFNQEAIIRATVYTITFAVTLEMFKYFIKKLKEYKKMINDSVYDKEVNKKVDEKISQFINEEKEKEKRLKYVKEMVDKVIQEKELDEKEREKIKEQVINKINRKPEYASMLKNKKYYEDYSEIEIPYESLRLKRGDTISFTLVSGEVLEGKFIGAKMSNSIYYGPYIAIEMGEEIYSLPILIIKENSMKKITG